MAVDRGMVTVRLFSVLREKAGTDCLELDAATLRSLEDVAETVFRTFPELAPHRPFVRLALNQEYGPADAAVSAGDEVALITPVSGG